MQNLVRKAAHYRAQAGNMRQLAQQEESEQTRKELVSLAEDYERLAEEFLQLASEEKG